MTFIPHASDAAPDDEIPATDREDDEFRGLRKEKDATERSASLGDLGDGESEPPPLDASTTMAGVRLMARFVHMQPRSFALSLVGGVGWSLLVVGATYLLGRITDEIIEPGFKVGIDGGTVWWGMFALFIVAALRGLSVVMRRWYGSVTETMAQARLRRDVSERLLVMPMSSYRHHPTGELLAHADVDVTTGTRLLMPLPFSVGVIVLLVVSLISLVVTDVYFAAVAVVLFPGLALLSRYYTNKVNGPAAAVQARLGEVSSIAHESFDGAMVIKTLGRERDEDDRFQASSDRLRTERLVVADMTSIFEPMIDLLPNIGMIALLVVGAWRIDTGASTAGQLIQAVALFGWLAFPMRIVGFLFEALPMSVVSVRRVDRVLEEPLDPAAEGLPNRLSDLMADLPAGPLDVKVEDLSFAYGDSEVLNGVTFALGRGETVALVGSTGSGKSTLANLIMRLDEPASGQISIGDKPISEVDPDALRTAMALAFQESFLFATSIAENVSLGRTLPPGQLDSALQRAQADRFVSQLPEADRTVVGERGVTLSGGQRQRIALARALAGQPRVLLLDDATSAVDPVIEAEILAGLRDGDTTMLIVAQRLSTILLADRIIHLEGGRIRGDGTHEELLNDPDYAALVTAYEADSVERSEQFQ